MEIKWLTQEDLPRAKFVWRMCFGDSRDFIDKYFDIAANVEEGLGLFDEEQEIEEQLVAQLFQLDFCARLSTVDFNAPFLAGCATMPRARKKGYMRDLIEAALLAMYDNGTELTYLHPFKHSFYRQFGYETVAYVRREYEQSTAALVEHDVKIARSMDDLPLREMHQAYKWYVSFYDNHFVRGAQRMEAWLELLFADGGYAAYIPGEERAPYALYYENEELADIFEMVYMDDRQRCSLVNATGFKRARYFQPSSAHALGNIEEFTMMRVVNPQRALKKVMYEEDVSFVIHITDAFLERDYNLAVEVKKQKVKVRPTDAASDIAVDICELARLLTGTNIDFPEDIASIFMPCSSCYFETY